MGRYLKGKIVGFGIRLDWNEGESGVEGECMQQEEFGGQGGNNTFSLGYVNFELSCETYRCSHLKGLWLCISKVWER